jgi:hypothetical protein
VKHEGVAPRWLAGEERRCGPEVRKFRGGDEVRKFEVARRGGSRTENVAALSAAGHFFEKEGEHGRSAAALRAAAALEGLMPTLRVTLQIRAVEQSAQTSNRQAAATDLSELRAAYRAAMRTNLSPAQREMLKIAEAAIDRFDKKLK